MIDHRKNEIAIVDALKSYLSTEIRPCEIVRQNQVAKVPDYPYVSYTVTSPIVEHGGTYCESEDNTLYTNATQIWSFTIQSDDEDEAMILGVKMFDFFRTVAITYLADNNIAVQRVSNLTSRDNLLTIQYEYRKGLDVTFGLLNIVEPGAQPYNDALETYKFKEE